MLNSFTYLVEEKRSKCEEYKVDFSKEKKKKKKKEEEEKILLKTSLKD